MRWLLNFLISSIGQKVVMALTGLFLVVFLVVHLIGNLQLLIDDGGEKFNLYAKFMTTNPLIKSVSYFLYLFILIHAVQGIVLYLSNKRARGNQKYAVKSRSTSTMASRNMGVLGGIILIFILIHLYQFWLQMKMDALPYVEYAGYAEPVKNLYDPVAYVFAQWHFVLFYVVCMYVLALHLYHGFQSIFQTFGLNHRKYTPAIKAIGILYSIVVPLGFAIIPIFFMLYRT